MFFPTSPHIVRSDSVLVVLVVLCWYFLTFQSVVPSPLYTYWLHIRLFFGLAVILFIICPPSTFLSSMFGMVD